MKGTRGQTDRKAVEASSTGALLMAVFGAVWAAAGAPATFPGTIRHWLGRGRLARRFNLVFGPQGVAIALSVFLPVRYGLGTLVPAVVALIVGVHFLPLAGLYGARAYHATGAALCAVGLAAFPLAPQARLPVVGLACAAVLLATGAYVLYFGRSRRPDKPAA